ncbi:hypothetical protein E2C01_015526 [Portunus trituberculatus]|uniref:Uncharacterized protein n=1 Tax=Portunus trituberculatus TaxID=210409 RepID=A0A5B7DN61_PORTR|nr:hypothetical protein [Portunus trituberculatus]
MQVCGGVLVGACNTPDTSHTCEVKALNTISGLLLTMMATPCSPYTDYNLGAGLSSTLAP